MKSFTKVLFLVMVGTLLASCAAHQKGQDMFRPQELGMTGYEQKVDNFLVILDASGSKQDSIHGQKKLEYAKQIVSRMNQTIPNGLNLNSALRRYGKGIKESQPAEMKTEIVYPPGQYAKARFEDALATVKKASGLTFMEAAIDAASEDLKAFSRKSAVIVVSDGKVHTNDPVQAAKRMKSRYGDNVCIHTIWIPSATADVNQVSKDKKLMEQIAEAGGCGFMAEADKIASSQGMGDFVRKVFLAERAAYVKCLDADSDGVCDDVDDCANTPMNVAVDARGCPVPCSDADGDGVCDKDDNCPGTFSGVAVDARGCPVPCSDADDDGICDKDDQCPGTLAGVVVDSRGCPAACSDSDGDGVCDKDDQCLGTFAGTVVDSRGCPIPCSDSDGDGVCDADDQCPNTPWGVAVDVNGCPDTSVRVSPYVTTCMDNDNDGICDDSDDCLNTPMGAGVNAKGCWIIENLLFDYDKSNIRERYYHDLDNVVMILKENPYLSIEIQGHTDSVGSQKYNLPLSERRAKAVMDYLVKKGIMKERLHWKGYGKLRPVAPNKTAEGRQLNRRVELHPLGQ